MEVRCPHCMKKNHVKEEVVCGVCGKKYRLAVRVIGILP
jgi:hypothetical protein